MRLRKPPPAPAETDPNHCRRWRGGMGAVESSGQRWLLVTGTHAPGRDAYATKVRRIEAETFDRTREAMAAATAVGKQAEGDGRRDDGCRPPRWAQSGLMSAMGRVCPGAVAGFLARLWFARTIL